MNIFEYDSVMIATGIAIFFARVVDVSLGTLRTISIVQGRKWMAFWIGFFEIAVWLVVISTVINEMENAPLLGIFYAFGFATGSLVGIQIENWLALGHIILKVISRENYKEIAGFIREAGFAVTIFYGEGKLGPVAELYIVCLRRDLKTILKLAHNVDPNAFYVTEQIGSVNKMYRPIFQPTGWRSVFKRK
jgi:uncharacterized protein YebE (UPF0316 family)